MSQYIGRQAWYSKSTKHWPNFAVCMLFLAILTHNPLHGSARFMMAAAVRPEGKKTKYLERSTKILQAEQCTTLMLQL